MPESPKPFMKKVSREECQEILYKAYEASLRGDDDEYDRLSFMLPANAEMVNDLKRSIGIEAVIASGLNLIEAVETYGEDWLRN